MNDDNKYFEELTRREDMLEKRYIDGKITKFDYEVQLNNIKLSRIFKQRELVQ